MSASKVTIIPSEIPDNVIRLTFSPIIPLVEDYFKNPANIPGYIEWHKKRYNRMPDNMETLTAILEGVEI